MGKKKEMPWFKLWRKSVRDELYFSEPFDQWHAWQDLMLLADPEKGTLKTSLKRLKTRWNWSSIKRVRAYLGTLLGTGKITLEGTPSGTIITLIKWEFYQKDFTNKGKPKKAVEGTVEGTQEDTSLLRSSTGPSLGPVPTTEIKSYSELNEELDDDW